jgi:hypothetical protein
MVNLETFDIIFSVFIVFLIYTWSGSVQSKKKTTIPAYKNFRIGLMLKISGAILFCLIYVLFYGGGDTTNYFKGVEAMHAVAQRNFFDYLELLFLEDGAEARTMFYKARNWPPNYMLRDSRTFTVFKITSIISFFGLSGFLATTILLASISFSWIWKLYTFMFDRYPKFEKELNWAVLFLPSTLFWGSGIMKDTFSFAATCYAVYGLHMIFIKKEWSLSILLQLAFAIYLIINIKSYILFALLPGLIIFANFERLRRIKSKFIKIAFIPSMIVIMFGLANILFFDFQELFGKYSADRLLEEAVIQNQDLQRDVYGSNSFDIGKFKPTIGGAAAKFLPAINAAIFRPYIWESGGSATMLFSGLETLILMVICIFHILKSPFTYLSNILKDPFLLFSLLFTVILGFGVGLSTSNFGALVRYKIPFMPFFVFMILVAGKIKKEKKLVKD